VGNRGELRSFGSAPVALRAILVLLVIAQLVLERREIRA
jgi:hypothetical protein